MLALEGKLNEERQKFCKQMENQLRTHREQMKAILVRGEAENEALKKRVLTLQKANEDNMKEIRKMRDLLAKQNEEERPLSGHERHGRK